MFNECYYNADIWQVMWNEIERNEVYQVEYSKGNMANSLRFQTLSPFLLYDTGHDISVLFVTETGYEYHCLFIFQGDPTH